MDSTPTTPTTRPSWRSGAATLAFAAVAATTSPAVADDPPFTIGSRPAWFLLGGVTGGGTVAFHDRGGFVGGELSVARLREGTYMGGYADGYYDFGVGGAYVTGGLELGHSLIGVDGGAALRLRDGTTDLGATGRIVIGAGVFSLYVRYAYFDADRDPHVIQVGALLKLPLVSPFGGH